MDVNHVTTSSPNEPEKLVLVIITSRFSSALHSHLFNKCVIEKVANTLYVVSFLKFSENLFQFNAHHIYYLLFIDGSKLQIPFPVNDAYSFLTHFLLKKCFTKASRFNYTMFNTCVVSLGLRKQAKCTKLKYHDKSFDI